MESQPQNPEFRINPENSPMLGGGQHGDAKLLKWLHSIFQDGSPEPY